MKIYYFSAIEWKTVSLADKVLIIKKKMQSNTQVIRDFVALPTAE